MMGYRNLCLPMQSRLRDLCNMKCEHSNDIKYLIGVAESSPLGIYHTSPLTKHLEIHSQAPCISSTHPISAIILSYTLHFPLAPFLIRTSLLRLRRSKPVGRPHIPDLTPIIRRLRPVNLHRHIKRILKILPPNSIPKNQVHLLHLGFVDAGPRGAIFAYFGEIGFVLMATAVGEEGQEEGVGSGEGGVRAIWGGGGAFASVGAVGVEVDCVGGVLARGLVMSDKGGEWEDKRWMVEMDISLSWPSLGRMKKTSMDGDGSANCTLVMP